MSLKADFTQDFVRDQWYAAAWSTELGDRPLARHILGAVSYTHLTLPTIYSV